MKDEAGKPGPAAAPLSYAPPDPPKRVSWLDLVGHAIFAVGLALLLGGFAGREYRWGNGDLSDFLQMYYPHMVMVGAFMCGLIISVRLGPFPR